MTSSSLDVIVVAKTAVSVIGAFIVIDTGFVEPEKEPDPILAISEILH